MRMDSSNRQSHYQSIRSEQLSSTPNEHSEASPHTDLKPRHSHHHRSEVSKGESFSADGHPREYYEQEHVRIKRHGGFFKNLFSNPLLCYIFGLVLTGVLVALFFLFLYL